MSEIAEPGSGQQLGRLRPDLVRTGTHRPRGQPILSYLHPDPFSGNSGSRHGWKDGVLVFQEGNPTPLFFSFFGVVLVFGGGSILCKPGFCNQVL